jgi:hypothetical protein
MMSAMDTRPRSHESEVPADPVERLDALEAEVAALSRMVETMMRASTATIVRQAKVEAGDLMTVQQAAHAAGGFSPSVGRIYALC